jgi:hypothetical protein
LAGVRGSATEGESSKAAPRRGSEPNFSAALRNGSRARRRGHGAGARVAPSSSRRTGAASTRARAPRISSTSRTSRGTPSASRIAADRAPTIDAPGEAVDAQRLERAAQEVRRSPRRFRCRRGCLFVVDPPLS